MEVESADSTLDSPTTSRAINMMDLDPNIMDEPYDSGFLQSSAPIPIRLDVLNLKKITLQTGVLHLSHVGFENLWIVLIHPLSNTCCYKCSARTVAGHEAARLGSQLAASQKQRRDRELGIICEPRARSYDHQRQDKPEKCKYCENWNHNIIMFLSYIYLFVTHRLKRIFLFFTIGIESLNFISSLMGLEYPEKILYTETSIS